MTDILNRMLLALCIWREARGESFHGKVLVGDVIKNRVLDARWPNNYRDVVLQPKQFSCFNAGDPNAILFPTSVDASWQDALLAADQVAAAEQPSTTANHYHVVGLRPAWADAAKITDREGRHVFYRL